MKCPPLYVQAGGTRAIVVDEAQKALDEARRAYNRAYTRGYSLSERGSVKKAQDILDRANRDLNAAEQRYLEARGL
jgi:hypothetical protein